MCVWSDSKIEKLKCKILKAEDFNISNCIIVLQRTVQTPINADVSAVKLLNLLQQEMTYMLNAVFFPSPYTTAWIHIFLQMSMMFCAVLLSLNLDFKSDLSYTDTQLLKKKKRNQRDPSLTPIFQGYFIIQFDLNTFFLAFHGNPHWFAAE